MCTGVGTRMDTRHWVGTGHKGALELGTGWALGIEWTLGTGQAMGTGMCIDHYGAH